MIWIAIAMVISTVIFCLFAESIVENYITHTKKRK